MSASASVSSYTHYPFRWFHWTVIYGFDLFQLTARRTPRLFQPITILGSYFRRKSLTLRDSPQTLRLEHSLT
jgi:hypothetical protein